MINTGATSFPFTLGWHPYFCSTDLNERRVIFDAKKKLNIGHRNITRGIDNVKHKGFISFGQQDYDDCWKLEDKKIIFTTPNYKLELISSQPDGFLQVYTPPKANMVAIEPTTGVSNSFNNNIGLKTLQPKEVFKIKWSLKIHAH